MLTEAEIMRAVRNKIKGFYPKYPVNLDDSKEKFRTPCFFLKLIRGTVKAGKNITYNVCTLYVTYFPRQPADPLDLYAVKDTLTNIFWNGMPVSDRVIKFGMVSSNTIGQDSDVAEVTLPFTFYDSPGQPEDKWLIENIYEKINE